MGKGRNNSAVVRTRSLTDFATAISNGIKAFASSFSETGEPVTIVGNDQKIPKQTSVGYGINYNQNPRAGFKLTPFETLEYLAKVDVVAIGINYLRNQISAYEWDIVPSDANDTNDYSEEIRELRKFFRKPDKKTPFSSWIKKQIYNILVFDACTIYKRRNKIGGVYGLEVLPGDTIKVIIDNNGRIPEGDAPAFEQLDKGRPYRQFKDSELIYRPMNPTVKNPYGISAVEAIGIALNIYLRKQEHLLSFYKDGTSVDSGAFICGPEATKDSIVELQRMLDEELMGNSKARNKIRVFPVGKLEKMQALEFRAELEEYLIKIVCSSLNVPQSLFIKQMNKATADNLDQQQEQDGLIPYLLFFQEIFNDILSEEMDIEHLRFKFKIERVVDPKLILEEKEKAVKNGWKAINEIRKSDGQKPTPGGDDPYIMTPAGVVLVKDLQEQSKVTLALLAKKQADREAQAAMGNEPTDKPPVEKAVEDIKNKYNQELKAYEKFITNRYKLSIKEGMEFNFNLCRDFESNYISNEIKNYIENKIKIINNEKEIKQIFQELRV